MLNCILINSRSLVNKLPDLHNLLYDVQSKTDVYFFTESWLNDSISDGLLDPKNLFIILRHDRPNCRGGGVCVFVQRDFKINRLDTTVLPPEIDLLCFDILNAAKNVSRFYLIYRPPDTSHIYDNISCEIYLRNITDFITANTNTNGPTIVLGDMNCPSIDWKFNQPHSGGIPTQLIDFVNYNGMIQCVHRPTFNTHILDIVLLNDPLILSSLSVTEPFSTSDHCSVSFSLNFTCCHNIECPLTITEWKNAYWVNFNSFLLSVDWIYILSTSLTADVLWTTFKDILNTGIELFVPNHTRKSSNSTKKPPRNIRRLINNKKRTWRASKQQPYNPELANKYKTLAIECKEAIEVHEIELENRVIDSNNIGTFYKYVNKKLSHPTGIGTLFDSKHSPVVDDLSKAELLNHYFQSVYTNDNNVLPQFNSRLSDGRMLDNISFSRQALYYTVKQLSSKTTCDPEGYCPLLIKKLLPSIVDPLCFIFQSFMSIQKIPTSWKQAIITPIFKKGVSSDPRNYRPISLTSVFGKLMERVMVNEILLFLSQNNLISRHQHGFLKKLSTCTNLLETVYDWTVMLENNSKVAVAYIDFF